jgi:hypothetical protein
MMVNLADLPAVRLDINKGKMSISKVESDGAGYFINGTKVPDWMVREAMRQINDS